MGVRERQIRKKNQKTPDEGTNKIKLKYSCLKLEKKFLGRHKRNSFFWQVEDYQARNERLETELGDWTEQNEILEFRLYEMEENNEKLLEEIENSGIRRDKDSNSDTDSENDCLPLVSLYKKVNYLNYYHKHTKLRYQNI